MLLFETIRWGLPNTAAIALLALLPLASIALPDKDITRSIRVATIPAVQPVVERHVMRVIAFNTYSTDIAAP